MVVKKARVLVVLTLLFFICSICSKTLFGQETSINWKDLQELYFFKQLDGGFGYLYPNDTHKDSIKVDIEDAKFILKKMKHTEMNCKNPGNILGLLVFKGGKKRYIRINNIGFQDISDDNNFYLINSNKDYIFWNWKILFTRERISKKDSIITELKRKTEKHMCNNITTNKKAICFIYKEEFNKNLGFLINNITIKDISNFSKSDNVIFYLIALLTKIYKKNNNDKYIYKELKKLAKRDNKYIKYEKLSKNNMTFYKFCYKILVEKNDIYNPEINIKNKYKKKLDKRIK